MKEKLFRFILRGLGLLLVLSSLSCAYAGEEVKKTETEEKWELRLLWTKEYEEKIFFNMTDDGEVIIPLSIKEGGEMIGEEIQFIDREGKITKSFTAIKEKEERERLKDAPSYMKALYLRDTSKNGKYLLFSYSSPEVLWGYSYRDDTGKELWSKEIAADTVILSPDGEYLGYSGALNGAEPSVMDWWELRDKDFNLLWEYHPNMHFDAVVLNGGRTLMVEGNKVRLYDKEGKRLKELLIPGIPPYELSYQMGCVLPVLDTGPDRLVSTKDGRYAAFVYCMYDEETTDWLWTLYSVDMEEGKWWSYPLKDTQARRIFLTEDGKNVIVFRAEGLFFFDNKEGKLLWKDTRGWDVWDGELLSSPEDVSEYLGLIIIRWSYGVEGRGDKEKYNEEGLYILNFQGQMVWKTGGENFSYHERFSKNNRFLLTEKEGKVSLYELVKR